MSTQRKIVWEMLYDPLPEIDNSDLDEVDEDDEEEGEHGFSETDGGPKLVFMGPNVPQIVPTPLGPAPLNDPLNPRRVYDFQVGHTNFALTLEDIEKIRNVAGVEIILFTKYRFIIGCGKLFDVKSVKLAIQSELYGLPYVYDTLENVKNDQIREQIQNTIEEVSKNNKFWAIYVYPNGRVSTVLSNDEEVKNNGEWIKMLAALREAKQQSGGLLFVCKHT